MSAVEISNFKGGIAEAAAPVNVARTTRLSASPFPRAAVAGIGLATPLGTTASSTWDALLAGRFITDHARVPLEARPGVNRVAQLASHTARQAVADAGWTLRHLADPQTAILVGTSKGPIEDWIPAVAPLPHMALGRYVAGGLDLGLAGIATHLARELGICGPRLTLSAACASGLHAIARATLLIQSGACRRALVVAAESSLHPLFLASFQRLGVLPKPGIGCRPFNQTRDGFLMSEAAAAVCLEANSLPGGSGDSPGSSTPRGSRILVDRFALGGDATHLTGTDPDGRTLRRLLRSVIDDRAVDLIHAHGTGTASNDPTELAAIEAALPTSNALPSLYSHKGALGHSLGAAGLVSIVLNCLCHRHSLVPPSPQTRSPIPMRAVHLAPAAQPRRITRSIAIAAGFGGPTAVVGLLAS